MACWIGQLSVRNIIIKSSSSGSSNSSNRFHAFQLNLDSTRPPKAALNNACHRMAYKNHSIFFILYIIL